MAENGTVEMTSQKGNVQHSGEEVYGAYSQVQSVRGLDRYITLKPAVGFALTSQSSWMVLGFSLGAALLNGGPSTLVYGTILVTLGSLAIAASIGELASINPVVGAQYRWSALYAPGFFEPQFWGLLQGWITVFSWIFLSGLGPFILATAIQGVIIFTNESYVPERWHGTLMAWAYLAIPVILNVYGRRLLKGIEIVGGILYIVFYIVTIVTLVTVSERQPSEFVFNTSFFGFSGYTSEAVQWCIGLLTVTSVLIGFDGVIHLAAEVTDAPRHIPRAMVLSVGLNGILVFGYAIALLYSVGNIDEINATPTGYQVIELYYQATGSKAATIILMVMLLFAGTVSVFGLFASTSRLTWAFANDRGLPFADFFAHIHPTLRIPLNSLWLITGVSALLALINIGSTAAVFGVFALATMGLYTSYVIPIIFVLIRKLQGRHPAYGPFALGRFGIPINIFAICYSIYIIIFTPLPTLRPVTAENMNYAGPILGFVILLAFIDYFVSGRKRFILPKSETQHH